MRQSIRDRVPNALKRLILYPLRPVVHPRRFHAYCVGLLKSGTHSMAAIFKDNYRAEHEPEIRELAYATVPYIGENVTEESMTDYLRKRDRRIWLEMESSHLLFHSIDILLREFPKSKYILTIRDCYSWMNSYMNHHLSHDDTREHWWKLRRHYFRADQLEHEPEEETLRERGLYTVRGYLSYWSDYYRTVIDKVPAGRLLVIRTDRIGSEIGTIAEFLNIDPATLSQSKSHMYKAKKRIDPIREIGREYLKRTADQYCSDLMEEYFPEIVMPEDAFPADSAPGRQ